MKTRGSIYEKKHFEIAIISLTMSEDLRYPLSFRNLVEMITERNLLMARTPIMCWIQHMKQN